ncbi:MAG: alpha-L-fucosidase [Tepidisphaerales bacterium]
MPTIRTLVGLALMVLISMQSASGAAAATETKEQREARMAWWREARFGMFIHWGPVSLKGTEIGWSRQGGPNGARGAIPNEVYDNLYKEFNPTKFDAREWVSIAQAAGMKYMVFTSKHHDGFCEFDSQLTDYKITSPNSPFKRDIIKELADACHAAGLKFGPYYSQPDSHHPDYRKATHAQYIKYLHGQVRELLSNYGKIDIIWFDGLGGSAKDWDAENLLAMIRQLQPEIIINNRCGLPADFSTPEQTVGAFNIERPWETCMTICNQWAWKPNDPMKSLPQCLQTLATCAGGDGNLLFNVGPMPTGEIEPRQVARLKEMGQWLGRNGESIYGTRGGPYKPTRSLVSTRKGDVVYMHVLKWNGESVTLPALPRKVVQSSLLSGSGAVQVAQTETGLTLTVARQDQQEIDTVIKLKLDGPAEEIPPMSTMGPGLIKPGMKATASNVFQNQQAHAASKAIDGDSGSRWATDAGTKQAWLEVDLGQPMTFNRAEIDEAYAGRVQSFELQYKDGAEWKMFYKGRTIGENFSTPKFDPVTAQVVRLNILQATEGPTINEFQLFNTK